MTIFVTGGAGFIGSAVIRYFIANTDYHIVNIDKLTYAANVDNLRSVEDSSRYRLIQADICNESLMNELFLKWTPAGVIHLAAESHVDRSIDGPRVFMDTNILGTYALLNAARNLCSRNSSHAARFRFLHVSTDEVYGSLGPEGYFTEQTSYAPNSPYSASKAASDMLVRAWHHTYGLPTVISNCSNNYGPCQFPEKLIPVVILNALHGKPLPIYGTGANIRDWLYVEDHARALYEIFCKGRLGETYNIGGNQERTNLDLVKSICRILDELLPDAATVPHEQLVTFVADRPGHDARYAIDASKIARELNWRPSVTLEEGLRKTVEWYLTHREWWQNVLDRGHRHDQRLGTGKHP